MSRPHFPTGSPSDPASNEPVLFSSRAPSGRWSAMTWRRATDRGDALRIGHGTYCLATAWFRWPPWDRYLVAAVAHALSSREPVVFTGMTAVLLHGLPLAEVPGDLFVRVGSRGSSGRRPPHHLYPGTGPVLQTYRRHLESTGQAFTGRFPVPPGIRKQWTRGTLAPVRVKVTLSDGAPAGEVLADPLDVAVADVLGTEGLEVSAVPADALKRRYPADSRTFLDRALPHIPEASRRGRVAAAWAFADGRAESPGESLSRARIHGLGFVVPEPQRDLYAGSRWIARVDEWWEGIGLAGEFDGESKYSEALRRPGDSWQEVLVREKEREDAIRRTGAGVMRWVWKDLRNLQRFERLLLHHGVPRRPSA